MTAVTSRDAVKEVDLIILTVPLGLVPKIKELLVDVPDGVIIVETMNYYPIRDGIIEEIEQGLPESVWVQNQIGRPVIKAFNNLVGYSLITKGQPAVATGRIALSVSGDDEKAKIAVIELVNQTGFDGYDAGSISDSWRQQPGTPAYCTDLELADAKLAREKAIREKAPATRDFLAQQMMDFGEEYLTAVFTGNYPDGFTEKVTDLTREYFGISVKTSSEKVPDKETYKKIFNIQKSYSWQLRKSSAAERIVRLERLRASIIDHKDELSQALNQDLGRPVATQGNLETDGVIHVIDNTITNLAAWMAPTNIEELAFAESAYIKYESKGVVLLFSAWNFPVTLLFDLW